MYLGRIVESVDTDRLFENPLHPYTEALLSAVPKADPLYEEEEIILSGEVPDPSDPPAGCHFHPRCSYVSEKCRREVPDLKDWDEGHRAACHLVPELSLRGVESRR